MPPKPVSPAIERVERQCSQGALFSIDLDLNRSLNRLSLTTRALTERPTVALTNIDVTKLGLLPGSRWSQAHGWHSYFGIPFRFAERLWMAVGAEAIVSGTNGEAHPAYRAYVFPLTPKPCDQLVTCLQGLAKSIDPAVKSVGRPTTGVVIAGSRSPEDHVRVEAWIVLSALSALRSQAPAHANVLTSLLKRLAGLGSKGLADGFVLFRTLILSEHDLMKPGHPGPNFLGATSGYLMATVPSIRRHFSWRTRIKIGLCRNRSNLGDRLGNSH